MSYAFSQFAFNAGELSPYIKERVDVDKYGRGLKTCENFLVTPYGAIRRRPGTQYIAPAKHADKRCRLIRFQFSVSTTFVIEMGNLYMRFFSNGVPVTVAGSPYEVATPYTESQLREVQFAQINDIMYFVHPLHPVRKLSRIADDNWNFGEIAWVNPPFRDENIDTTLYITPSGTTGAITLTCTAGILQTDGSHDGSYWRIGQPRDSATTNLTLTVTGASSWVPTIGNWEVTTDGTGWTGTLKLLRTYDGGTTTETLQEWRGNGGSNFTAAGEETLPNAQYKLDYTLAAASNGNAVFTLNHEYIYGVVQIDAVTSATTADATVVKSLLDTSATNVWSEGSWSTYRGFPRSVTLHEQRMVYGGNLAQAQTVWASDTSNSGGYDTFTIGTDDTDSFQYTLGAFEFNGIQWLQSHSRSLLIGTAGGEFALSSGSIEEIIKPENVRVTQESNYGSEYIQAVNSNNIALFVERGGRKLREIGYRFDIDGYASTDLTILSEHISKGGFQELAHQSKRDTILWTINGAGELVGLTYERTQEVVAWHRHTTTDGAFESVACISETQEEDEVWLAVKRTVNGATVRYIERFYPEMWRKQEDEDQDDLCYTDSSVFRSVGASTTTMSGLGHLEGEAVLVLVDGAADPGGTVSGGSVTFEQEGVVLIAGLPMTSIAETMNLEVPSRSGTSQGREKRVNEVVTSLYKSSAFKVGRGTKLDQAYVRDTSDLMDVAVPLFTGRYSKKFRGNFVDEASVKIVQDLPTPLTIMGLVVKYDVTGE